MGENGTRVNRTKCVGCENNIQYGMGERLITPQFMLVSMKKGRHGTFLALGERWMKKLNSFKH